MKYTTEGLAAELKQMRKKVGLTQKELGKKTGIPQSHVSRIENGEVDIQTSSLVEIARVLGLELMLVPRELTTAVEGLMRGLRNDTAEPFRMYIPDKDKEED